MKLHNPAHPGSILKEYMDVGQTVEQLAEILKVTSSELQALLNCDISVSPHLAIQLGKYYETNPLFWLNMSHARDTWIVEQSVKNS